MSRVEVSYAKPIRKRWTITFKSLEKIIERIAFHNLKLNVLKCEFAKNSILYLGWIVSHDFLLPDPRRMSKIKNAKFPQTKKEMRSFLGLVNSIRRVIPTDTVREMSILQIQIQYKYKSFIATTDGYITIEYKNNRKQ